MKNLEKYPDWFILKLALNNINDTINLCDPFPWDLPTMKTFAELKVEFENAYNLAREEKR